MADILGHELQYWLPQEPWQGPPLPEFLNIYWSWYKPPTTEFRVSDLVISSAEVNTGQVVTISCTVTNTGGEAGTYTVKLGGDFIAEQTVTLQPGESKTVAFKVTPTTAKTYQVSVDGQSGSFKAIAPQYPIVFTGATISPISVLAGSGWWGTSYYAVAQHFISWNAAHRIPEVEGSGSGQINVTWQLSKGATSVGGGAYTTTPQTREPSGAQYYYFPPGPGSVGWPYAGGQVSFGNAPPALGLYNYTINVKALVGAVIVGENTFEGTVQVS